MANVVVCSRLIHGLKINLDGDKTVHINGQNSTNPRLIEMQGYDGTCGFTPMDEGIWEKIKYQYRNSPLIRESYIFAEKTQASAQSHSDEVKGESIGNEQYDFPQGTVAQ